MFDLFEHFHFIRPLWFYALLPTILIFIWLFLKKQKAANWSKICDQELLNHFLVQNDKTRSRYPIILLLITWLISVFALAGPSWKKTNAPIYTNQDALVIILDLSSSMNANDIKPSRLERAKHKLSDLLRQRQEGQTALLVYAGDAHIVSPLTPDNNTILSFIPVLDSSLMPIPGSNLNKALTVAEQLFKNAGIFKGEILLLTDGIDTNTKNQTIKTIQKLKKSGYSLSIIGVGTKDGAPIPDQKQKGFIKDNKGNIVLSKLNSQPLKQIASTGGGKYHSITITDQDIQSILNKKQQSFKQKNQDKSQQEEQDNKASQWKDQGALFVLFLLPLALLMFRRGWLLSLLIILLPYPYQPAYSMQWEDLWLRADQQGKQSFSSGQHEKAAEQFSDPQWKASALYKAGKYQQAIEQYKQSETNDAKYNTANSLAKLKQFDEAIQAYNEVLEKDPQHQDSIKNKKIIEDLLKQQQEQQKQNQEQQDNKDSDQKQDKNQDDKQNKDQNQQSKSDQKQSDKDQQSSENKEEKNNDNESEQSPQDQEKQKKEEQEALNKQKEKQQKEQQEKNKKLSEQESKQEQDKNEDKQAAESLFSQLSEEEQQSMQQYLQQIKDDPAYLLRRKFYLNSTRAKQQDPNSNQNQAQQPW